MFIYNGWIRIAENTMEINDGHLEEIMIQLQDYIDKVRWQNAYIDLRAPNGFPVLSIQGCNNHKYGNNTTGNVDSVLDVFKFVGEVAPGSYGLLFIEDDDEPGYQNACQVFVLKRGKLGQVRDPFFSPLIPTVEDPDPRFDHL